ncbi:hypothetical protein ZPAH1_orf00139 [Aeromonas phage ZPAH1]|nr:hypothetical protein ASwh1_90 [Aeromonas phage Aswh_1]QQG33901.1 hypothetical protein ZPAH1_orf00139 [Aeromonas phage ZPAH1]
MIYELIMGTVGSGKTTRLLSKAAQQVMVSPIIVITEEMDEHAAFSRINDFISPDSFTFEMCVSSVQGGALFNGQHGLKQQLVEALERVPDATHVFVDVLTAIPTEVFDIIGDRELVVTKQAFRP